MRAGSPPLSTRNKSRSSTILLLHDLTLNEVRSVPQQAAGKTTHCACALTWPRCAGAGRLANALSQPEAAVLGGVGGSGVKRKGVASWLAPLSAEPECLSFLLLKGVSQCGVDRSLPLTSQCALLTSAFLHLDTRRTATYLFTQLANLKILIQSLTYNSVNQNSLQQSAGTKSVSLRIIFIFLFRLLAPFSNEPVPSPLKYRA